MVLDVEPGMPAGCSRYEEPAADPIEDEGSSKIPDVSIVESSSELLYGLVHQRFIITRPGLTSMVSMFSFTPRFRLTLCSSRSTKTGTLALAPESTATQLLYFQLDDQILLVSTLSSSIVRTVVIYIYRPVANISVSTEPFLEPPLPPSSSRHILSFYHNLF